MGFLDNFLKKLGAKLATRYGVVSSGEFNGCSMVMGNPPKAKVSVANSFSQVIFIRNDEETARYDIGKDIIDLEYTETIKFPKTGNDGFRCKLTFKDGGTCDVDLFPSQVRTLYSNLKVIMREETDGFFAEEVEKLPQA